MPTSFGLYRRFLVIVILVLTHILSSNAEEKAATPDAEAKLLFVAELCRHGDRAPIGEYPSDVLPASRWPEGVGQLTAIGQRAHYELGQRLRARYVDTGFLSPSYSPAEMYVLSTDVDRTLMSATSQLAGLYPPGTAPNGDVRVKFGKDALHDNEGGLPHLYQPIPIHTKAVTDDMLLLPGANCKRHDQIIKRRYESDEYLQKEASERDFLTIAGRIAQVPDPANFTLFQLHLLMDTWTCDMAHSVPLQKDATPDIVAHARNLSDWLLNFDNQGLAVHRLRAGLILNTVREYMVLAALRERRGSLSEALQKKVKKFVLLSAHDTTLGATLAALRVFDGKYPPYNSTVIWQLFQKQDARMTEDESLFVRLEYNGKPLILPGCTSENCSVNEYMASTRLATVFSERERWIECLTGAERFAARFWSLFSRPSVDTESVGVAALGKLKQANTSSSDASIPSTLLIVLTVVAVFSAVIALLVAWRVHRRYDGYYAPSDTDDTTGTEKDPLASRRILM